MHMYIIKYTLTGF